MSNIISQQFLEGEEVDESLIDIKSEHFVTYVVLHSCLKHKLLEPNGAYDPAQETALKNSIWRMIEQDGITLAQAMKFAESKPRPVPKKSPLDAWYGAWQYGIEKGHNDMDTYRSSKINARGVTILSEGGQEITVPFSELSKLSRTINAELGPGQEEAEQDNDLRHRALDRKLWYG